MVKKSKAKKPPLQKQAKLNVARIVAAAVRIADREGLEALSMRGIAEEMGSGVMSLYRHVSGKDRLLDLLLDEAYGEIAVPDTSSGDWQTDLREMARQTRQVLKRHWWLGSLLTSRPTFGPNYLRWFEFLLAATAGAVPKVPSRVRVIGTVFAYINGVVGYELGEEQTNRRHDLTPERKRELAAPHLAPILASGLYPNLALFVEQGGSEPTDESFELGLDCVLDGIAMHLADRNLRS
jgi:AcrR family transcriptional regulator